MSTWKVSDLYPNHLIRNSYPLFLLLCHDLEQETAHCTPSHPFLEAVNNKSDDFTSFVRVLKLCLQSKWPQGFCFPKVGAGMLKELPANPCEWLVLPHSAGQNLHIFNTPVMFLTNTPTYSKGIKTHPIFINALHQVKEFQVKKFSFCS